MDVRWVSTLWAVYLELGRSGLQCLGFKGLGFKGLGFKGLGFRDDYRLDRVI